jgi:hypothetical protein
MIEVYNFLDGKNLCNIFASLIVEKINEFFSDAQTEITVVNVRNFFIVKGRTNSESVINCAETLQEFLENYDEELSKTVKVIDTILYNTKVDNELINISYDLEKKKNDRVLHIQNFLNGLLKDKIYINIKIDDEKKYVFYDSQYKDEFKILEILSNEFIDYNIVKIDLSNVVYTSERYYGLSNNTEKFYHILLRYITHHLFSLGISKKVIIELFSDEQIFTLDNLNVEFSLDGQHIVKKDWLESLVLDVFPFEYSELKTKFNFNNIKTHDEIITNNDLCVWKKLDLSKEFVLI